jgi:hypothetical protein
VLFRVTNKSSRAKVYEKSARLLPSSQASLPLPLTNSPFALQGGTAVKRRVLDPGADRRRPAGCLSRTSKVQAASAHCEAIGSSHALPKPGANRVPVPLRQLGTHRVPVLL